MLIDAFTVFEQCLFNEDFKKSRQREDRDHDGFNALGFSWQVFCLVLLLLQWECISPFLLHHLSSTCAEITCDPALGEERC